MAKSTLKSQFSSNFRPSILALEDGTIFEGLGFGASGVACGELVFNTSLAGYQEILTDPSYAGQVITMTAPEIGNYGINSEDMESRQIFARGLVIRHLSTRYSNWRAEESLDDFLKRHKITAIAEVDTRAITRHIREKGALRCAIYSTDEALDTKEKLEKAKNSALEEARKFPSMEGMDLTAEVTCAKKYKFSEGKKHVAVLDFGIKQNILRELASHDLELTVYPAQAKAADILADKPQGIFLSNGPGDPAACKGVLKELPELISSGLPIFGICLGHQLLSIALGASTYKLKFGHRGGNQPVKNLQTGKVEVTCQNHGFAVDANSMPEDLEITHLSLNDDSVEGFKHKTKPIFAVQYHPESCPGPHDSKYLFEDFLSLVESH